MRADLLATLVNGGEYDIEDRMDFLIMNRQLGNPAWREACVLVRQDYDVYNLAVENEMHERIQNEQNI